MSEAAARRTLWSRLAILVLVVGLWLVPVPEGLTPQAWHLFALFAAAIAAVVIDALSILVASLGAAAGAVLTGTIPPAAAYAGFANGTIVLIVVAFLVARAVVTCGLGHRIGLAVVSVFGRSTLGLAYSLFLVDAVIAPAFPSNTARSGVLYPLAVSLAETAGAKPEDPCADAWVRSSCTAASPRCASRPRSG
jgi:DASS family divalent anion:Na+ symporter